MSWSWGVAHRTKDCSGLALELLQNVLTIINKLYYIICNFKFCGIPIFLIVTYQKVSVHWESPTWQPQSCRHHF
jgi:hypothetical protein